jgi:hypothetical protein
MSGASKSHNIISQLPYTPFHLNWLLFGNILLTTILRDAIQRGLWHASSLVSNPDTAQHSSWSVSVEESTRPLTRTG